MKNVLRRILLPFRILGIAFVGKLFASIFIIFDNNKNRPRHMGLFQTWYASLFSKHIEVTFKWNSWYPLNKVGKDHWNTIVARGSFEEKDGIRKEEEGIAWRPISKEEFEVCYYTIENFEIKRDKPILAKKDLPLRLEISKHLKSANPVGADFGDKKVPNISNKQQHGVEIIVRRGGFRFYF